MQRPMLDLISARYSCRTYRDEPVAADLRHELADYLAARKVGPFGSRARFAVVAAAPDDPRALRRLGTYGFIKGATGFLVGAVARAPKDLEDYGYLTEQAVLFATGLGLGTCWLGGTFTKGTFATRLGGLRTDETMPAVVALGYAADDGAERIRRREAGSRRLPASPPCSSPIAWANRSPSTKRPCPSKRPCPMTAARTARRTAFRRSSKACAWPRRRPTSSPGGWCVAAPTGTSTCSAPRATARAARSSGAAPDRPAACRPGHRNVSLRAGRTPGGVFGRVGARRAGRR